MKSKKSMTAANLLLMLFLSYKTIDCRSLWNPFAPKKTSAKLTGYGFLYTY